MEVREGTVICGDCLKVIPTLGVKVDGVITSPPYNLGKNPNHRRKDQSDVKFYSTYEDAKAPEEYIELMVELFGKLEKAVKSRGVILFNMSYSSKNASLPYRVVVGIEEQTKWKLRDTICWKKPTAIPFQTSPRNLSRISELVFVFAQRDDFITNKKIKSVNPRTKQKFYEYMDNYIEAASYDPGTRKKHKATFSRALVRELLERFFPPGSLILDPFCGTGTTGIECQASGRDYIMIDIDPQYVDFSEERLEK